MRAMIAVAIAFASVGCTSVQVNPLASSAQVKQVCIIQNPRVQVSDFIGVLRDGFSRHGIATSVVSEDAGKSCDTTLSYTATRGWDFKPYLAHAELRLWRQGTQIGSADYHLKGKGGFAVTKWRGTKAKMDPVIDQLLAGAE